MISTGVPIHRGIRIIHIRIKQVPPVFEVWARKILDARLVFLGPFRSVFCCAVCVWCFRVDCLSAEPRLWPPWWPRDVRFFSRAQCNHLAPAKHHAISAANLHKQVQLHPRGDYLDKLASLCLPTKQKDFLLSWNLVFSWHTGATTCKSFLLASWTHFGTSFLFRRFTTPCKPPIGITKAKVSEIFCAFTFGVGMVFYHFWGPWVFI